MKKLVFIVTGFLIFSILSSFDLSVKEKIFTADDTGLSKTYEDSKLDATVEEFRSKLEKSEALKGLMDTKWTLEYFRYDRCTGSTEGRLEGLKYTQVDELIYLEVRNDGDGWACEKKDPSSYEMEFSLKRHTKTWTEFVYYKIDYEKKSVEIWGKGESDFITVHFTKINGNYRVNKIEYTSEDPG